MKWTIFRPIYTIIFFSYFQLKETIRKLEEENLSTRSWELSGEVAANQREENALLETQLEFDITSKPGRADSPMIHFKIIGLFQLRSSRPNTLRSWKPWSFRESRTRWTRSFLSIYFIWLDILPTIDHLRQHINHQQNQMFKVCIALQQQIVTKIILQLDKISFIRLQTTR